LGPPRHFAAVFPFQNLVPVLYSFSKVSWRHAGMGAMPIKHLLRDSKLGPEDIKKLEAAYTYALRSLSLVDRNDPLCEIIARKIVEVGAAVGDSDPRQIANWAVKKIGIE